MSITTELSTFTTGGLVTPIDNPHRRRPTSTTQRHHHLARSGTTAARPSLPLTVTSRPSSSWQRSSHPAWSRSRSPDPGHYCRYPSAAGRRFRAVIPSGPGEPTGTVRPLLRADPGWVQCASRSVILERPSPSVRLHQNRARRQPASWAFTSVLRHSNRCSLMGLRNLRCAYCDGLFGVAPSTSCRAATGERLVASRASTFGERARGSVDFDTPPLRSGHSFHAGGFGRVVVPATRSRPLVPAVMGGWTASF